MTNNQKIRNPKKEKFIELMIRWWGAGAVYFFIGWGTGLGSLEDPFDFIFILGLAMGLTTIVILNPLIYGMFDIERKDGELYNKKYNERTIMENVFVRMSEIVKAMIIVLLIFILVNVINIILIQALDLASDSVPFPGEPITFGIMYCIFYYMIRFLTRALKKLKG